MEVSGQVGREDERVKTLLFTEDKDKLLQISAFCSKSGQSSVSSPVLSRKTIGIRMENEGRL